MTQYNNCQLCPRQCAVNRNGGERGFCGADSSMEVNRIDLHFMEEPPISGSRGSGTVFFTHCNLGCCYCQNKAISRADSRGRKITVEELAVELLALQKKGAHNLNFVTPTHYMPSVRAAVTLARGMGLSLPVVYNTGGFERAEVIAELRGTVDVFLTDLKYFSPYLAGRYSSAEDYYDFALPAAEQMLKITGEPVFDREGMLVRGTVIRHLVLPGQLSDTVKLLSTIAHRFGDRVLVSLMRQYTPPPCPLPDLLDRPLNDEEYLAAAEVFNDLGLCGFLQEADAVGHDKTPEFFIPE